MRLLSVTFLISFIKLKFYDQYIFLKILLLTSMENWQLLNTNYRGGGGKKKKKEQRIDFLYQASDKSSSHTLEIHFNPKRVMNFLLLAESKTENCTQINFN